MKCGKGLVFADSHCHSNPVYGLGASGIAKKFKEKGGWFIALVSLPPYHYGIGEVSIDAYRRSFDIVLREAKKISEAGIKTRVFLGFHPAEVDEYSKKGLSLEKIVDLAYKVLDLIVALHRSGLVDGIGEVGRQHYSTSPSRFVASELIMIKALELARDNDMLIHLHLEQGGFTTIYSIDRIVQYIGVSRNNVFLHHVGFNESLWANKMGLWHTVPGKYRILKKIFEEKNVGKMMPESDFIDDPRRPGVSSYPWDIVDNQLKLLDEGIVSEEMLYKINVDNIVNAYGVEYP